METMVYKSFTINNFRKIDQLERFTEEEKFAIEVVGNVLPFKTDSYVVEQLIDWNNVPDDPIYTLVFPQKEMLKKEHFDKMAALLKSGAGKEEKKRIANEIRQELNPHPAGQMEHNVPEIDDIKLTGIQHKYDQTMLFFPQQGQTCHSHCTFCFRWPQFVGVNEYKFAMKETELMVKYIKNNPQITDVLFTGGDPLVIPTKIMANYIEPLLEANLPNLNTIRLGTKSLSFWPYRFFNDKDSDDLIRLFEKIVKSGKHLAIMAHFNHSVELSTPAVEKAIQRIRNTGAQIRTQSPIMKRINDHSRIWRDMWKRQVNMGLIPYYMFVARDTGARDYFAVTLENAWEIFKQAYSQVSGVARTVRGPSMSADPGKVQILGVSEINNEKVFVLRFLQGRNSDWVHRPFFAKYDKNAVWLDDLQPAFNEEKFFFEKEFTQMYA